MEKPHVFVSRNIPQEALQELERSCQITVWQKRLPPTPEQLRQATGTCEGLLCLLTDQVDVELLEQASHLRIVSTMSVGYEHIDLVECRRREIAVGHTPGVLTEATADFTLALILAAARRLPESMYAAQSGDWLTWEPMKHLGVELAQSTVGILGLGRIGSAVAKRLAGFNPNLVYHSRTPKPEIEKELRMTYLPFETLIAESDILSLHVPLTPETLSIIGEPELLRMKSESILINTGRGELIDSKALMQALKKGEIGFVALDVTDPEPLPPDHPLFDHPNSLITPHIASATHHSRSEMAFKAVANLVSFFEGRPLPHPVQESS